MASARPMTSRGDWLCKSSRWRNSFGVCWFNIVFFKQCQFILLADWLHSFRSIKRRLHKKLVTRLSQEMCGIQGMSEMPICSSPQSSLVDLSSFGVGHGTYFYLQLELLEYTCPYPCPTHKIRTQISRAATVVHRYFITGGLPLPPGFRHWPSHFWKSAGTAETFLGMARTHSCLSATLLSGSPSHPHIWETHKSAKISPNISFTPHLLHFSSSRSIEKGCSVQEKPKYLYSRSSHCVRDQNCVWMI